MLQVGLAEPLASVSLIPEHRAGSSESIRHVELTGAMEPDEWEIEADELELGPRIGIGSFGEVYRATWRHTDVAVKKILEQDLSPQLMQVTVATSQAPIAHSGTTAVIGCSQVLAATRLQLPRLAA